MKGLCVDPGGTTTLTQGKEYFLFQNGPTHFYVCKFDNPKAHFGCYQKDLFQVIAEEAPQRPPEPPRIKIDLTMGAVYRAFLVWVRMPGHRELEGKHYYVRQHKTQSTQVNIYDDPECTIGRGTFQKYYFIDYELVESKNEEAEFEPDALPEEDWEQMSLF